MTMGDHGAVRPHPARLAAAGLSVLAAMTAFAGTFVPLFSVTQRFGPPEFESTNFVGPPELEIVISSWSAEVTGGMMFWNVPTNGLPVVFAGIVLVFAAVVCRRAADIHATPGTQRMAGVATVSGGAFLVCAAWMVALQVSAWSRAYEPDEVLPDPGIDVETSYLAGYWVLLAAAVFGVAAVVPSLLPVPPPPPEPEVDPDAPTPPFGIALPEGAPVQTVDPLTGEPTSEEPPQVPKLGPIVIPDAPPAQERPSGPAVPPTEDPLADPRLD